MDALVILLLIGAQPLPPWASFGQLNNRLDAIQAMQQGHYPPYPGCRDLRTAADLGSAKALDAITYCCA